MFYPNKASILTLNLREFGQVLTSLTKNRYLLHVHRLSKAPELQRGVANIEGTPAGLVHGQKAASP